MEPYCVPEIDPFLVVVHDELDSLILNVRPLDACDFKRSIHTSGVGSTA